MSAAVEQKVIEVITQLQGLAEPAMETALRAVQLDGILSLIGGFSCLGIAFVSTLVFRKGLDMAAEYKTEGRGVALFLVSGVAALFSVLIALCALFQSYNWIAAIDPAAATALKILDSIG